MEMNAQNHCWLEVEREPHVVEKEMTVTRYFDHLITTRDGWGSDEAMKPETEMQRSLLS